jgi:hypothetical protein
MEVGSGEDREGARPARVPSAVAGGRPEKAGAATLSSRGPSPLTSLSGGARYRAITLISSMKNPAFPIE